MSAVLSLRRGVRARQGGKERRRRRVESIEMRKRRHGYFPKQFVWRGKRYDVEAVERCWTVARRNMGNRVGRHCFRVRCAEGTFNLYQDARYNTWHIRR